MEVKVGDTLKYLGFSNNYYIVEKNGEKGYVERHIASFYLKDEIKKERDSIIKVELELRAKELKDKILNGIDEFDGKTKMFTEVYN